MISRHIVISIAILLLFVILYIHKYEYEHISTIYNCDCIKENDLKKMLDTGIFIEIVSYAYSFNIFY